MSKTKVDVASLYCALDAARTSKGWSWRQLAKDVGVSPSLLTRMGNGFRPDADGFATLTRWLGMPAEHFMTGRDVSHAPELGAQLAPLLRASNELSEADVRYLEEVIQATVRRARAERSDEQAHEQGTPQAASRRGTR